MPALLYLLGTYVAYLLKSLYMCNCEYYYSTELMHHAFVEVILHWRPTQYIICYRQQM